MIPTSFHKIQWSRDSTFNLPLVADNVHDTKKRSSGGCPLSRARRSTDLKQMYEEEPGEIAGELGSQYSAVVALEWTRHYLYSKYALLLLLFSNCIFIEDL